MRKTTDEVTLFSQQDELSALIQWGEGPQSKNDDDGLWTKSVSARLVDLRKLFVEFFKVCF